MADASPNPESNDPFSSPSSSVNGPEAPSWEAGNDDPWADRSQVQGMSASLALDMARLWVQRHQKASMLGAFAVGTFIGALLRD